ncbi:hypothetical protein ACSPAH_13755 [Buttiauxella agrestis]
MTLKNTVLVMAGTLAVMTGYAKTPTPDASQANNPLANMTAFNMQNYYIGDVSGSDKDANQFWFRYAKPFSLGESQWLLRASLPINTYPSPPTGGIRQD